MAAQVLSGSGNITYTNTTGQNVRVVINFLQTAGTGSSTLSFQGVSLSVGQNTTIGKNVMSPPTSQARYIPLEFAISNGETFSVIHNTSSEYISGYNFIIIPEAG